ncbi:hypothetical protein [Mycobacterium sp. 94-17]|nr:hypothetical protein [Mycobacterium sp. 94-17]MEB4210984.1 hypothetical protein [Mycobacterium sp. 94-17]
MTDLPEPVREQREYHPTEITTADWAFDTWWHERIRQDGEPDYE